MTTPQSKWQRHQKKQPTASQDTKEMSIGQRLNRFRAPGQARTEEDGIARNRFGDTPDSRIVDKPDPVVTAPAVKTPRVGHTVLDENTLAAKAAYESSKQGTQDRAAGATRLASLSQISEEDCSAILTAFFAKHSDFFPSAFNVTNLMRGLAHCVEQGAAEVTGMNIRSLEVVWDWLAENGFTEKAKRYRGEPAALVFNPPAPQEPEPLAQKTVHMTVATREEVADLKSLPFEEHQKLARQGYKTRKPNISDFQG